MSGSEDTEITLGTGKMLALFFGLVALCAVFFGMGFSLGKSSSKSSDAATASSATGAVRPTAVKANNTRPSSDLTFYKAVGQKNPDSQLTASAAEKDAPSKRDGGYQIAGRRQQCATRAHRGRSAEFLLRPGCGG